MTPNILSIEAHLLTSPLELTWAHPLSEHSQRDLTTRELRWPLRPGNLSYLIPLNFRNKNRSINLGLDSEP